MAIEIPPEIQQKLDRLTALQVRYKMSHDLITLEMVDEISDLQCDLVSVFLPLVQNLVAADLLTINLDVESADAVCHYSRVFGNPTDVWDNGNIWIDAAACGGCLKREHESSILDTPTVN
jgi:hypothetical protein